MFLPRHLLRSLADRRLFLQRQEDKRVFFMATHQLSPCSAGNGSASLHLNVQDKGQIVKNILSWRKERSHAHAHISYHVGNVLFLFGTGKGAD